MTTTPRETATPAVPGFELRRWRRFGHDRLYVTVAAGDDRQLGYRDLATGLDHPVHPADTKLLAAVADRWSASPSDVARADPPAPDDLEASTSERADNPSVRPWQDLTHHRPGQSAQAEASLRRSQAPVRSTLGRLLDLPTPDRSWRLGAKGERLVAAQLDKLSRRDRRWSALHAIPVGTRGADIDHLVVGPGGVFSLNAKHHPDADVWIGGDTFLVNGARMPYVRNSRHEASRATRLLSAAVGREVRVTGLIVPVGCKAPLTIRSQPLDVHVVARRDLASWLGRLGPVWGDADLHAIRDVARRSTTWLG